MKKEKMLAGILKLIPMQISFKLFTFFFVLIALSCQHKKNNKPINVNNKKDSISFINLFDKKVNINASQDSLITMLDLKELAEFYELGSGHYGNIYFQQYLYDNKDFFTSVYCDFKKAKLIKMIIIFQGNVEDNKNAKSFFQEQSGLLIKKNDQTHPNIFVDTLNNNYDCKLIWVINR